MTTQRVGDRSGVVRRRAVRRTVVRALLTSAALVVLYYRLPMTGALDTAAIARLVVGLLVFTVLIAWQVRAILRSAYPPCGRSRRWLSRYRCSCCCSRRRTS